MRIADPQNATNARRAAAYVAHTTQQRTDGMAAILEEIGPDFPAFFGFAASIAQIAVEAMREYYCGDLDLIEQSLLRIVALAALDEVDVGGTTNEF